MSTGRTEGELREDIEQTRQQLGQTAEALAAKADVKARAKQKVSQVKEQAAGGWLSNPSALAAAAAVVFAGIAIMLWRRR
jgi:hypothetical protein